VINNVPGKSRVAAELRNQISVVSKSKMPLLLIGDTGTGKERIAEAIHRESGRKGPFVPVNCAGLSVTLMESTLFGHEKGAFTGADSKRDGVIKRAEGGTIFLDEITEMPLEIQSKLLRFLQDFSYWPLGYDGEPKKADVRILTATNTDIKKLVAEKQFRKDLYFRITGDIIRVPSLKERKEDIRIIAENIIKEINNIKEAFKLELKEEDYVVIENYNWPGNIRQLYRFLERCRVYKADSKMIKTLMKRESEENTQLEGQNINDDLVTLKDAEKYIVKKALAATSWNLTQTAARVGIALNTLKKKIKEYGLSENDK
jgi:transcriptional regulator with PAS, ATPase and Fis domain